MECPAPTSKPKCLVNANFSLAVKELPVEMRRQDAAWLIGRNSTRNQAEDPQAVEATDQPNTQPTKITSIPVWSAYNSLVSDPMPTTRVGTPPGLEISVRSRSLTGHCWCFDQQKFDCVCHFVRR